MRTLVMCIAFGAAVLGCEAAKCTSDLDCVSTRFCQFPAGECGGEGLCVKSPADAVCIGTGGIDFRNCGCDDVTYESDCWRKAARTSKQSEGACP
ncbi:MAG: hypothetical protein JRG91_06010 [Deltaproteobacteria bacterium]|nr:hypothetical protein [Deltaproteobacteria bacterium]